MKNIGMVVAMQKELIPFLKSQNAEVISENRKDFSVLKFKIGDNNIICVNSGIGEIYASAATQTLIGEYKADIVINFGVCGTLCKEIKTKEVVLVKGIVHYDFDLSTIADVKVGQYPGFSSQIIDTDESLRNAVLQIMPEIKEVVCASADKFVADEQIKKRLRDSFGASVCEMECAGVALTAKNAGVPVLVIKAVSDGEGGVEEYHDTVEQASKAYIGLINELSDKL